MTSVLIIALLSSAAVMAVFVGIYFHVERPDQIVGRLETYASVARRKDSGVPEGKRGLARVLARLDRLLSGQAPAQRLGLRLAQANVRLTVPEFMVVVGSSTTVGAALGFAFGRHAISALAGAAAGFALPWILLERKRQKRINGFHDQLVDVLALVVGSLRGGHALLTALDLVSKELSPPASEEFTRVLREITFGLSQSEALNNLVARMETDDLQLVVTAVNISHEVGGNLSGVLEKIAETLRERIRLQGEIRVLTTQQRLTSYVLAGLPIMLAVALGILNPQYMMPLIEPGPFRIIPVVALISEAIGFVLAQRLALIEV